MLWCHKEGKMIRMLWCHKEGEMMRERAPKMHVLHGSRAYWLQPSQRGIWHTAPSRTLFMLNSKASAMPMRQHRQQTHSSAMDAAMDWPTSLQHTWW